MLTPLTGPQLATLEQAVLAYEAHVGQAADYLAGRGFTPDVARMFRLGVVAEPAPGHDSYRGRLSIPYLTPAGVVDIRFRALQPDAAVKYMGREGVTPSLYNVGALRRADEVIVLCEGELDAITMDALVGVPAVGVPGVNSWQPYWSRLFPDYGRVVVPVDGDDAGKGFGHRIAKQMSNAVIVHMPPGHDVNSLYTSGGADVVLSLLGIAHR